MTFKINKKVPKDEAKYVIEKMTSRKDKETYLRNIGLFKEEAIKNMSDKELNELIEVALKVKGIIK